MKLNRQIVSVDACDISYWQKDLDAEKMKNAGIKACIVRAGYGTTIDKGFITYINKLVKVGIQVGVYWFIYASDKALAIENAKKCIEVIGPYKNMITCGVWADWEYDSDKRAGYLTTPQRCVIVQAFLDTLAQSGYDVGIYSNQDYIASGKFTQALIKQYPLWFAKYSKQMGEYANKGQDEYPFIWQYTSSGKGSDYGVQSTTIDLDQCNIDTSYKLPPNIIDSVQNDSENVQVTDNPYPKPTRIIKYVSGAYLMRGDDVKHVQWHLWRFGLLTKDSKPDASEIDGIWGKKCDVALRVAQGRLGLTVDGKCGPATLKKFNEV